jgi:crotonobetainyl-CoA:carnitine CoA-transferase CaiB-like acyl-CoA transferase
VAAYLAAMGADVVKVESIQRPDGMRFAGGVKIGDPQIFEWSAVTHGANVGLRDVTLDLSRDEGAALARRLVDGADIVVDNFSPRVLDSFGLSEADMRAAAPDVVIVRMPAFGLVGPWRDRGGFAMTVEQNSGLAWLTGYPDDGPLVPRGVCDVLGGLHAVLALLGALEHRSDTGEGLLVEVPLAEAALNIAAEQTIEWTANGVLLERGGNRSIFAAPQGVYACADEDSYVVLSVETEAHWEALKDALGRPGWADDEKLDSLRGRNDAHDAIDAALTDWLRDRPMLEAVETLAAHGVPAGFFQRMDHPVTGPLDYLSLPMTFSGLPRPLYWRAAPTLGQDNEEVLRGLGLTDDEIAKLAEGRIIGTRPAWM